MPVLFSQKSGPSGGSRGPSGGSRGPSGGSRGPSGGSREPGRRPKMVAAQVFEVLSLAVTSMLEDPRLLEVSVTHVEITPDLSQAKVYITSASKTVDLGAAVVALQKAAGFLRRQLAAALTLRRVPDLKFFPDTVLMEAWKLDDVISGIKTDDTDPKTGGEK
ncbi:MAG: ribosome-binding factor A [Deltaproteobacteria bacterium HGW-Deltaproteobacteria-22]|nr:MAG: ribosome-binding factor A [Deltaproteobacteria bacterium HGW-Deltaproteobacteria-22]